MHINEGKGNLALFSTKDNVLLTLHLSYSSAIDLFPSSMFLFPLPPPHFYYFPSSILFSLRLLLLHLLLHLPIFIGKTIKMRRRRRRRRKNNRNEEEEEEEEEEGIKALRRENNKNEVEAQVNESPA